MHPCLICLPYYQSPGIEVTSLLSNETKQVSMHLGIGGVNLHMLTSGLSHRIVKDGHGNVISELSQLRG